MLRTLLLTTALLAATTQPAAAETKRPNFLFIVADDLGFSDLGAFGGEIDTPHLDALAHAGLRLTGFHTAPMCSPTRAMLLTGSDSHRTGLGAMRESSAPSLQAVPGYEGFLRADAPTLAERLSEVGYRTLFSGKWHLGVEPDQDPHARGFQQSFSFAQGAHYHFGPRPASTWADPEGKFPPLTGIAASSGMINPTYREDGVEVARLPDGFFSSDTFASKLIDQIKSGQHSGKPFFAYLAFTAPHAPLHAPKQTIAKYKGRYDDGYEALRARRVQRQVELGLAPAGTTAHPLVGVPRWDELSPDERRLSARTMEVYAAMVDNLDHNVGRVVAALRETGELDNTVIVFLSDNGAEGGEYASTKIPSMGRHVAASDNSLDNLGANTSFISYGPAWAQAASAPSRLYKSFASEGGTRAVAFISGPLVKRPGTIANTYTHVTDLVPTVLETVGAPVQPGRFAGRAATPIDGVSWTAFLRDGAPVYAADRPVGTELHGARSIRQGDWKITATRGGDWELFNIAADPGETRDLSVQEPDRRAELIAAWDAYAREVNVIPTSPAAP